MTVLPAPGAPSDIPARLPDCLAANGQTLEIELRHATRHEIGDDPRGAARHRPAHVTVPAVEEEVAMSTEAENRGPIRSHRPEAGAVLPLVVVGRGREEVPREAENVVEIARRPAPVVTTELGRRRQPEPIAEAGPPDQPLLVDPGNRRRETRRPDGERRRIALG